MVLTFESIFATVARSLSNSSNEILLTNLIACSWIAANLFQIPLRGEEPGVVVSDYWTKWHPQTFTNHRRMRILKDNYGIAKKEQRTKTQY